MRKKIKYIVPILALIFIIGGIRDNTRKLPERSGGTGVG